MYKNPDDLLFWLIPKNEFYWVLFWLKPVSYRGLWWKEYLNNNIKIFFLKYSIKYKIMSFKNYEWDKYFILVYSKDINLVDFFVDYYENHKCYTSGKQLYISLWKYWLEHIYNNFTFLDNYTFSHIWWILLWYPPCCINFHLKNMNKCNKWAWWVYDSVLTIKDNSNINNYYLNNIFNLWWRGNVYHINSNDFIYTESLSLINHQTCSFKCKKSLINAIKLEKIIKKIDINYLNNIYYKIKKNYLYFNYENWLAFDYNLSWLQELKISYWILMNSDFKNFFTVSKYIIFKKDKIYLLDINKKISFILWKEDWLKYLNFKK